MEQLEIIKLIEKRKNELEELLQEESIEVKFCEEYTDNYKGSSLDDIANMSLCDLFITIYRSKSKVISFEDLHNFVSKNQNFIKYFQNENKIMLLAGELEELMLHGKFDVIQSYFSEEKKNVSFTEMLTSEYIMYRLFEESIRRIVDYEDGFDIYTLMEVYKQDGLEIFKTKAVLSIIDEFQALIQENNYARTAAEQAANQKLDKKTANKIRLSFLSGYNIEGIKEYINSAMRYVEGVLATEKKKKRKITKQISSLDKLEQDLFRMLANGEITKPEKIIEKIEDEDIRLSALKLIYNHNIEIYKKLQEEHEKLSAASTSSYKMLLSDYGISSEYYDVADITNKSLEEVSIILETLKKYGITGPRILVEVLKNSNSETVLYLENLLTKNIIFKEFLIKNKEVFSPESLELRNLKRNIDFFSEKGLNIHYLRASQEILIMDSAKLEENIAILEDYEIVNSLKTGISSSFLQQDNLADSIDVLLELGYEKYLENSLEILNYSHNFPRLRILKELNIPVSSQEELLSILSSDKFIVPIDEIASYIYNATDYLTPTITLDAPTSKSLEELEKYSKTKRTYDFNGVLISKNKVKRNIATVSEETDENDKLVYSIVKGSILSDEEFETIDNIIRGKTPKTIKKTSSNE